MLIHEENNLYIFFTACVCTFLRKCLGELAGFKDLIGLEVVTALLEKHFLIFC